MRIAASWFETGVLVLSFFSLVRPQTVMQDAGRTELAGSQSQGVSIGPDRFEVVLNYMLSNWPEHSQIDAERIGMFGFSLGGFTALVAIGGTPELISGQSTTKYSSAAPSGTADATKRDSRATKRESRVAFPA